MWLKRAFLSSIRKVCLPSVCATVVLAIACKEYRADNSIDVSIDISQVGRIVFDDADAVVLDNSDEALIYDICGLEKTDGRLIVHSRNLLKTFDAITGEYLCDISRVGDGDAGGHSIVSRMWRHGDTISVFDANTGRITDYNSRGEYLGHNRLFDADGQFSEQNPKPSYIIETPGNDGFFSINTWMGDLGDAVAAYSLLTTDGRRVRNIPGRYLRCGAYLFDRAYSDKARGRTLVWDALCDTLFNITPQGVETLYCFDFGPYAFPSELQQAPELSTRIGNFTNAEKRYVSMLGYYQTHGDRMYFSAYDTMKHNYIIVLNENSQRANVYELVSSTGRFRPTRCFKIEGDSAIVALYDTADAEAIRL